MRDGNLFPNLFITCQQTFRFPAISCLQAPDFPCVSSTRTWLMVLGLPCLPISTESTSTGVIKIRISGPRDPSKSTNSLELLLTWCLLLEGDQSRIMATSAGWNRPLLSGKVWGTPGSPGREANRRDQGQKHNVRLVHSEHARPCRRPSPNTIQPLLFSTRK